jgi:hypothetical protein
MSKIPSRPNRPSLVRLASSLPKGSEARRGLLRTIQSYDRWQADWLRKQAKQTRFTFRNQALKDLWNEEFTGQISDGMWENTRNTGWEFWGDIPTSVGSKTQITGPVPGMIKQTFGFNQLMKYVGDRMLEIVQQTEPDATMGTVILYTKEIMKALQAAKKGEEPPDAPGAKAAPAEGSELPDGLQQAQTRAMALKAVQDMAVIDGKPLVEAFMYNSTGRRAGSYHYFVVLQSKAGYQALSAYGKIGKRPKAIPLTQKVWDKNAAIKAITQKARSKLRSNYFETSLEGVLKTLRLF